jgi:hypothetical protein
MTGLAKKLSQMELEMARSLLAEIMAEYEEKYRSVHVHASTLHARGANLAVCLCSMGLQRSPSTPACAPVARGGAGARGPTRRRPCSSRSPHRACTM